METGSILDSVVDLVSLVHYDATATPSGAPLPSASVRHWRRQGVVVDARDGRDAVRDFDRGRPGANIRAGGSAKRWMRQPWRAPTARACSALVARAVVDAQ